MRSWTEPLGARRRLTVRRGAAALAAAACALAVQAMAWRASGLLAGAANLLAHALVLVPLHAGLCLVLAGRREERPWAAALLLAPAALAALPAADRFAGFAGIVLVPLAAGALGAAAAAIPGWRLSPLLAAAAGAAGGTAVAAGSAGLRPEPPALAPTAAWWLLAAAVVALAGQLIVRPRLSDRSLLPPPRASAGLGLVALGVAAVCGSLGAVPAPLAGGRERPGPPPVVLVVLDTLRADHLRSYGYQRDTMPRLERFAAAHAARVERSLANAPSSLESHAAMFTGLTALRHGARKPRAGEAKPPAYAHPLGDHVVTVADLLSRRGYRTFGVSANFGPLAPAFGLGRGFGRYSARPGVKAAAAALDPLRLAGYRRWPLAGLDRLPPFSASEYFEPPVPYRRADEIVGQALAALDEAGQAPFFLFANFMEPHYPYRPPRSFGEVFAGIRRPGRRRLAEEQAAVGEIMAGRREATAEERAAWIAAYDSELRYLDRELERLLVALGRHPRFDEMLILVTSDHGEGFGEHGLYRHSTALYDEMLRVPLFVKPGGRRPPGWTAGAVRPGPFQSVDVFPTILDHAGLPVPAGLDGVAWGEGRGASFAEAYVHPPARPWGGRFAEESHAVEIDSWKLIRWSSGELRLYHLESDPGEHRDLAAAEPQRAAVLAAEIRRRLGQAVDSPVTGEAADPLRALRALGYVQ